VGDETHRVTESREPASLVAEAGQSGTSGDGQVRLGEIMDAPPDDAVVEPAAAAASARRMPSSCLMPDWEFLRV
jgi:hypothetical protein